MALNEHLISGNYLQLQQQEALKKMPNFNITLKALINENKDKLNKDRHSSNKASFYITGYQYPMAYLNFITIRFH
jgi:hypothetical protein